MEREEVYTTTGSRMMVRFFGGRLTQRWSGLAAYRSQVWSEQQLLLRSWPSREGGEWQVVAVSSTDPGHSRHPI